MRNALVRSIVVLLIASTAASAAELSATDLDRRRKALNDLLNEQWEYALRTSPEFASLIGDKRYNAQSSDVSESGIRKDAVETLRFLQRFQAINTAGFNDQEQLNKELMVKSLQESLEDFELREWETPVTQMGGIHLNAAQLPGQLSFTTAKDYDDFLARMRQFPKQIDDTIAILRKGMADRLMPPKFLLEKVAGQAQEIADTAPDKSAFAQPLSSFPDSISEADRSRIRAQWLEAIRTSVIPAYTKFARFVREEYAPAGRTEVGMWSLPQGAKRYATRVRHSTTTNLTPEEIHNIGLSEVKRIEAEQLAIASKMGFSDLKSFTAALNANPDLHAKSGEQILQIYRGYIEQMYAKLPQLFGRLPKAKIEVAPTESFREKASAGADYDPPAQDGSRPGRVHVNTYDATSRKTISMESTAYHEGVPGHHMQIAIAQEITGIPDFRRYLGYTAYVEGWALYSERLGKEVGFYQNPYNDFGRLNDEMLRAVRLVVDTGLHAKKWSRQQVVDFFHDHAPAIDEVEVQSETDRYIVVPGQALGYKIGQLTISRLREKARAALGDRFDIREFHDEVLGAGALPMNTLEERIDRWIAS
ncbi:MAG: DUF885 domain-containing protein, partial [Thermoanaerobaculia bacterium]